MTTWAQIFSPVQKARGLDSRPQQAELGQAILDSFDGDNNLVAQALVGTGKSFAILIPMIHKILEAKSQKKKLRGVISTETLTLQDQYFLKDLPFLSNIYPGFVYKTLKGRSNYACFNAMKQNARGNVKVEQVRVLLDKQRSRVGLGERKDVETLLGYELEDHFWSFIAGSSSFCSENQCTVEECYSAKARAAALSADIVVVNHALLRVDADTREEGVTLTDAFLGDVDLLAVDEAHTLEEVLISGWTTELTEWELLEKTSKIADAVDFGKGLVNSPAIGYETQHANDGVSDFLKSVTRFFGELHSQDEWRNVEDTICLKYLTPGDSAAARNAMVEYEEDGLARLDTALNTYKKVGEYLKKVREEYDALEMKKGKRIITKGMTAIRDLTNILTKIREAMSSTDGTVVEYGVPYVVTGSGIERRNGDRSIRLRVIPLDISNKAKGIWDQRKSVLMSGTLMDLTDGTFKFATTSLGFSNFKEVSTGSPFDHQAQQLVYITPATQPKVDLKGAQFSLEEMVDLIRAAKGRSLILFTAKAELDVAVSYVRQLVAAGDFPWTVLAQEKGVNKRTLAEKFAADNHSVLFASKSFFTGNDFPGETLSLVTLVKFPFKRYDAVCKQQIKWWRSRGFSKYYEMKALEVFHQAAGRCIRTTSDIGVVALLDQRAMDTSQRVYETTLTGVKSLGSPVTQDINQIKEYLS